jgi:hypothetical protein
MADGAGGPFEQGSEVPTGPVGTAGPIVVVRHPRQKYGLLAVMAAAVTVTVPITCLLNLVVLGHVEVIRVVLDAVPFALVFPIVYLALTAAQHTVLDGAGIGSNNGFRVTGMYWGDVLSIDERTTLGITTVRVVGRRRTLRLPTPWTGPGLLRDPDYAAKLATMRSWWLTYTPVPPMGGLAPWPSDSPTPSA